MTSSSLSPFERARRERRPGGDGREQRAFDEVLAASDPAFAEFLGLSNDTLAGTHVSTDTAFTLSAFWRGVSVLAGTIAGLPLITYEKGPSDDRARVSSVLDRPMPRGAMTAFEWKELLMVHVIVTGNAYHAPQYTNGGELMYLRPVMPSSVEPVKAPSTGVPANPWGRAYWVTDLYGARHLLTPAELFHIPGMGFDGIKGMSLIQYARQSLGSALASDQAAARQFGSGLLLGGVLSSKTPLTPEQAEDVTRGFRQRAMGVQRAGDIAFVPADISFTPWLMSNEDAQFLESRNHSVEDVARWLGLPKHLLGLDGASTWGAGLKEMNHGLARYTLRLFTNRIEERMNWIVDARDDGRTFAEFLFEDLLQPTPEEGIPLLIAQVAGGVMTKNEARKKMNLPGIGASGDVLLMTPQEMTPQAQAEMVGQFVRAGYEPDAVIETVGLPPIRHTGLRPTTLQSDKAAQAGPDGKAAPAAVAPAT